MNFMQNQEDQSDARKRTHYLEYSEYFYMLSE